MRVPPLTTQPTVTTINSRTPSAGELGRQLLEEVDEEARLRGDNCGGREFDCHRQLLCAMTLGVVFAPCAFARLFGHYTGLYDPMDVGICGKRVSIPGLEYCSGANGCCCGCDARGYQDNHPYVGMPQRDGSGLELKTLDTISLLSLAILIGTNVGATVGTLS
ncbi:MAG: hypothetical protein LVR00_08580 [Rhabdochlamydiaceae bacterium]|jgi:hypothetical protein